MAGREYFTLLDLRGQTYQTIQGIQRSSVDYYAIPAQPLPADAGQ